MPRTYTEPGIREMIPRLGKTILTSDAVRSYESAYIPIYTKDDLRMFLYLRELKPSRRASSYWRMEIEFGQWKEDHSSDEGFDFVLDRELAEAFGCYMDGCCIAGYRVMMPAMSKSMKHLCTGEDVVQEICTTIQRACSAKKCKCDKQFVFEENTTCFNCTMEGKSDDESEEDSNDCPICRSRSTRTPWTFTECCEKECHIECLEKCQEENACCPFCRSEDFDFAH